LVQQIMDPNSASLEGRHRRREILLVATLTALAATLRLLHLTSKSLWMDEGFSAFMAQTDISTFAASVRHGELNMVFYYALLRFWMHLGNSEFFVRLLSVLFSTCTIPVVYAIGERLFSRRVGYLSALLLSVHPTAIAFAQEARSYALEVFLVSLSTLYLLRLFENHSRLDRGAYILTSVLAIYSHVLAAVIPFAQWPVLVLGTERPSYWRNVLVVLLISVLLLSPIILFVWTQGNTVANWTPSPGWHDLGAVFRFIALPRYGWLYLLCWLVAIWAALHPNPAGSRRRLSYIFVLSWLLTPILIALLISLRKPILVPRFFSQYVPAAMLLGAAGIDAMGRRFGFVIASLTIVASLAGVRSYYRHSETKEDWRSAAQYVLSGSNPEDVVAVLPEYGRFTFDYYRQLHGSADHGPKPFALESAETPGLTSKKLWVVAYGAIDSNMAAEKALHAIAVATRGKYCETEDRQFNLIKVWRFERCPVQHASPNGK
jgi:mannosyltransferase